MCEFANLLLPAMSATSYEIESSNCVIASISRFPPLLLSYKISASLVVGNYRNRYVSRFIEVPRYRFADRSDDNKGSTPNTPRQGRGKNSSLEHRVNNEMLAYKRTLKLHLVSYRIVSYCSQAKTVHADRVLCGSRCLALCTNLASSTGNTLKM